MSVGGHFNGDCSRADESCFRGLGCFGDRVHSFFLRKMWNDLLAAIEGISFELKKIREDMTRPDEGDGNRT